MAPQIWPERRFWPYADGEARCRLFIDATRCRMCMTPWRRLPAAYGKGPRSIISRPHRGASGRTRENADGTIWIYLPCCERQRSRVPGKRVPKAKASALGLARDIRYERSERSRATFAEDGSIRNASFRPKLFRVLLGGCGPVVRSGDILHRPGIHPRKLVYPLKDSG